MKEKIHLGVRILLGGFLIISGFNGFFNFMPNPPLSPEASALIGAFFKTGYFLPMVKIIEILAGFMILFNLFAPLGALLITPILVGITSIHLFLNPAGLPMMIFIHLLHGIIVVGYKEKYLKLLIRKTEAFT